MTNLRWIYLTVVSIYFIEGFMISLFSLHMHALGAGPEVIGTTISAFFLASLIARFPTGALYTPARSRMAMGISMSAMAVCAALLGFLPPLALVVVRSIHGFAYGVATTVNTAVFFAEAGRAGGRRAAAMGIFSAALATGKMLGSLAGGWVAELAGFQVAFIVAGVCSIFGVWFSLMVEPDTAVPTLGGDLESEKPAPIWLRVRAVPLQVWAASTGQLFLNIIRSMWEAFFPLYATGVGLSVGMVGLLRSMDNLLGIFSRVVTGRIGKRFKAASLTVFGVSTSAVLVTVQTFADSLLGLGATALLLSAARSIATVSTGVGAMRSNKSQPGGVKGEERGLDAAVYNIFKDIGNVSGPALGGAVAGLFGVAAMLRFTPLVIIGLYAVSLVGFWAAGRRQRTA